MYDKTDPRATLSQSTPSPMPTRFAPAQYGYFYGTDPQLDTALGKTWISRGQNMLVAFTQGEAGAVLARTAQPDEYCVILPDAGVGAEVTTAQGVTQVPGYSIAFIPAGESSVRLAAAGRLVRLFSPRAADIAALASNQAAFAGPHPTVPPFTPWPQPPDGPRVRHYSLDVPPQPGRFGRIFRCTTMMVNYLDARDGPRPRTQVSPHHHDDFEQCSLVLDGEFTHHLRWPWTTDMTAWRDDEHVACGAPSICIIPPPVIHTTTAEGAGLNQLVDIFAPPRLDFSAKPGWVLNEEDYPLVPGTQP
jgi:hypothetical protein